MKPEDLLRKAENSSAVAFHKFVLLCKEDRKHDLFCFFEGRDSQYYNSRIKFITTRNYHPISCGNKKSVLETYYQIKKSSTYSKYLKAYFVDRDFDPILANNDIYETPCYSVENFYVNSSCMSEILKNEFLLTEADNEYDSIMYLFNSELNKYNQSTILFNAWYAALKHKKNVENLKTTGVCLEEKLPKNFICLKIGSIISDYDFNKIKETFPEAIVITEEEIEVKRKDLLNGDISFKLRGKFQFTFLYEFLRYLIEDANKLKTILKRKTKFNADKASLRTQLSQYAITPKNLKEYLEKYKI